MPDSGGDRLGTYREVDDRSRAAALSLLDLSLPIQTFNLGEVLFNGYPGWATRVYRQRLAVMGLDPGTDFTGEVLAEAPRGPNEMTSLEERVELSYNIGTKVNGLAHAGRGSSYYGGRDLTDLVANHGITDLDTTTWGPPLVTRGLMIDVLAMELEDGNRGALAATDDGAPILPDDRHITVDDLHRAIDRQRLPQPRAGDALFVRTGWRRLIRSDPKRYLRGSPGVWLPETRWLASFRPAMVGTDSWCWGTLSATVVQGHIGACHQELLVDHGIRLAESLFLDELADAGVGHFVLCHAPIRAEGAVSTISPPIAIANLPG